MHSKVGKRFAPVVLSIAVLVVTFSFNRWQRRLGREQLRHQLYERRVAVYGAFRELLLTFPRKATTRLKLSFERPASLVLKFHFYSRTTRSCRSI